MSRLRALLVMTAELFPSTPSIATDTADIIFGGEKDPREEA